MAVAARRSACRFSRAERLQDRYRGSRADYDVAVTTYDRTLIGALRDVADMSRAAPRRHASFGPARGTDRRGRGVKLAGLRYRAGLSNQIVQLTPPPPAEDAWSRSAPSPTSARQLSLDIALIRAWRRLQEPPVQQGDE